MNCIIIEDQPPAQRILKKFIEDVDTLELTGIFSDAVQAMEYLKNAPVDLLFLDIHLPKISGIEFLRTMNQRPHIILTTAFTEYALEGYDLNVVDYLLKPFSFQRFLQAISKIPTMREETVSLHQEKSPREEIYVKTGHELVKIAIQEMVYLHSDSDYTGIQTLSKKLLSNEPLRYWQTVLKEHSFSRVHKSFIVNTGKIDRISGNLVYMINNAKIPIGRAYKESFMKLVLQ